VRPSDGGRNGVATVALVHSRAVAEKPRVKAPKQRSGSSSGQPSREGGDNRRWILLGVGLAGAVVIAVVAAVALAGLGGGGTTTDARTALTTAGCTLKDYPGVSRQHISNPAARPKLWNSFPPTTGPHYVTPAVYGFYSDPIELARALHGLEHGGVYMLYGSKTPANTVAQLRVIYDKDPRGLIVAPLPELGDKIALGAWTSKNPGSADLGTGHLAECTQVDQKAFLAFIKAYRGRGPEGIPLNSLQPGGT
jgi:hypothetical protein